MEELMKKSYALFMAFDKAFKNNWGPLEIAAEYHIQIGHLGVSLVENKLIDIDISSVKEPARNLSHIPDELSDCIFQLLTLSHFLKISPQPVSHLPKDYLSDYFLLTLLSGQLKDSLLIIQNKKFNHLRNENLFLKSKINTSLGILLSLYKRLGLDYKREFIKMQKNTMIFLKHKTEESRER